MATMHLNPPAPLPETLPRPEEGLEQQREPHHRPRVWRHAALWAALVVIVVAVASWLWRAETRPITVQIAPLTTNVAEQIFGLGTVGADVESAVGFKVAGVIAQIDANEGDHVEAGQVLARLDARDVAAQVVQAQASVLQSQAAIDKADADVASAEISVANTKAIAARREALVGQGFASAEETETDIAAKRIAEANLAVARTEVQTARAELAGALAQKAFQQATLQNYTLRAPYNGWVVARNLNLGAMPVPGQAVFTLVAPQTIWVVGYVDERLAGRLRVGQTAEIALRSEPGRRYLGHVARIEIQSNAVNEEEVVDVSFNMLPRHIRLDEQAEVYITTGVLAQAITVPQSAVSGAGDGKGSVWTIEDGRLHRQKVSFGPELLNGNLPITAGLPKGAKVVIAPMQGLRVGRAAQIVTEAGP